MVPVGPRQEWMSPIRPPGTIFGGVILSYIDQAGAIGARYEIGRAGWPAPPLVTVAMNSVELHQPIFVGECISLWTTLVRIGTTSITIHIEVEAERAGTVEHVTDADVTYVAVDLIEGKRRPVAIRGNM